MSHDPNDYLFVLVFLAGFGVGVWVTRVRLAQLVVEYTTEFNALALRIRELSDELAEARRPTTGFDNVCVGYRPKKEDEQ